MRRRSQTERKKGTEEEHPSEDIGIKQCAALGTTHSDTSGILQYCFDDERTAREVKEQAEAVHSTKRESEEAADSSEPPAKKRPMAKSDQQRQATQIRRESA